MQQHHQPVMVNEVMSFFGGDGHIYVDCTLGFGGHTTQLLQRSPDTHVIAIERDARTLALTQNALAEYAGRITYHNSRFSTVAQIISQLPQNKKKQIAGILFDLGISSYQLGQPEYSLSFQATDSELDMRLDAWCSQTAAELLNTRSEKKLADIFWEYADYEHARPLAKLIIKHRPLRTVGEFVELCYQVTPASRRHGRIHPATRPMMAIRMVVNDELGELELALNGLMADRELVTDLVVLSFHSGEDRLVKNICKNHADRLIYLTKKPLTPSVQEMQANPRSRSTKLRAVRLV